MRRFLAFKSFGDTVIACHHLRQFAATGDELLCAEHLGPLVRALDYPGSIAWMSNGERGVPAFFDIRKYGMVAAAKSAFRLRHAVLASTQAEDSLVFDRIAWRQRFLAAGRTSVDIISGKQNIYLDYEAFFGRTCPVGVSSAATKFGMIGVFPDSRIMAKEIPDSLIQGVSDQLRGLGYDFRIVRAGEGREINTFEELIASVRSFAAIISADSLPAHLAEYFGKPVYVLSPISNEYWLPKSAFQAKSHSLFGESFDALHGWLSRFDRTESCMKAGEFTVRNNRPGQAARAKR